MTSWILILFHFSGYALVVEEYDVRQTCEDAALIINQNTSDRFLADCIPGQR